jgi:hypothetical protein
MRYMQSSVTVCLFGALSVIALWSQSVDTGILGTISDSSGAVIAGATVNITHSATGTVHTVVTGGNGAYEVRYLVPGEYVVDVRQAGFRSERSSSITLRIGQMARVNFTIQVGEISEQVQVTAQGVLLETQNGVVGGVVSGERIVNLPLNGRNFVQLGDLTPGVITATSSTSSTFRANGARVYYQQASFDGVTVIDNRNNQVAMYPTMDAVQEFKVQTADYSAEYGGHAGANVQLQFRSGTNVFHGELFEFLRNNIFDARNFFSPAPNPKPTLRRNQFGGIADGPIIHNKTFFMASYEGTRERRQTAGTTSVLTQAQRQGDFSGSGAITDPLSGAPFANNLIPQSRLDPVSVNIINKYMPLPNLTGAINYAGASRSSITQDQYIGRIDHTFGPKDQVFGHYFYHGGNYPSVSINPNFPAENYFRNQSVAFQYLHTFSAMTLNEFRFGYAKGTNISLSPRRNSTFTPESSLGIFGMKVGGLNGPATPPMNIGFPRIAISGYVNMGDTSGGYAIDRSVSPQFVDNVSLIRGAHGLKTGVDIRPLSDDATTVNSAWGQIAFTPDITGNAAAAYMLGFPKTDSTPEGLTVSAVHQWRSAFYFQDDWRVNSRLTLNLGVRYDLNLLPQETNGVSRTLRFDMGPQPVLWPAPGQVVDLYIMKHKNIAPRFGFAYRLRDTWALRGGYGIFTMTANFNQTNTLQLNAPNASIQVTNTNLNPVATIQNPFPASLVPANPIYNVLSAEVDRNHKNGYYQTWNISVGKEISHSDMLEVRYLGAKGTHLDTAIENFNSPDPDPNATTIQSRRPYPQFGRIRLWDSDGNSNYNSLQAHFEHRLNRGLSMTIAYTLSHLIDDQGGALNGTRAVSQNPRCVRCNMRADSLDDQRHSLVTGYVWEIPFGSSLKGLPGGVLKGWMLGGILTLRRGSPISISQSGDNLNIDPAGPATGSYSYNEIRPDNVPGLSPTLPSSERSVKRWFNTAAFTRALVTYGTSPRDPVVGPGISTLDMSVSKSFRFREKQQIQFRWEAFNSLNKPQFGNPGGVLGMSSYGVITGTSKNNREMQLALKYMF